MQNCQGVPGLVKTESFALDSNYPDTFYQTVIQPDLNKLYVNFYLYMLDLHSMINTDSVNGFTDSPCKIFGNSYKLSVIHNSQQLAIDATIILDQGREGWQYIRRRYFSFVEDILINHMHYFLSQCYYNPCVSYAEYPNFNKSFLLFNPTGGARPSITMSHSINLSYRYIMIPNPYVLKEYRRECKVCDQSLLCMFGRNTPAQCPIAKAILGGKKQNMPFKENAHETIS